MKRPSRDPSWTSEIEELYRNDLREIWDSSIEPQSFNLYQNQLNFYFRLVEEFGADRILDVGCAQATLALLLAEAGKKVTALDLRPGFLEYARSRYETGDIEFVSANIMDRPQLGVFDIVFANQIIEHLVYPVTFLRSLMPYVSPGGVLILTTPNHDYLRSDFPSHKELGNPADHEGRQFTAGGEGHFFAYTLEELSEYLEEAGFEFVRSAFFESPWINGHMRIRHLHGIIPAAVLSKIDALTLRLAPRKLAHQLCVIGRRRTTTQGSFAS